MTQEKLTIPTLRKLFGFEEKLSIFNVNIRDFWNTSGLAII